MQALSWWVARRTTGKVGRQREARAARKATDRAARVLGRGQAEIRRAGRARRGALLEPVVVVVPAERAREAAAGSRSGRA